MSLLAYKHAGTMAELIKNRRTIRDFKSDPVPTELIVELLNVAVWAPNHGNKLTLAFPAV